MLSLPQACPADWTTMPRTAAGRHCASCRTEVVDFTQQSPAEILAYLRQTSGRPVCGRVYATQLAPPVAPGNRWGRWVGTLLVAASLSTLLLPGLAASATLDVARAKPVPPSAQPRQARPELARHPTANSLTIRGVVLDAGTRTPVPGITILLKNSKASTATDADGKFELTVVPKGQQVELVAAVPGYKTLVKKLSLAECTGPITLPLKQEIIMLGRISPTSLPRS